MHLVGERKSRVSLRIFRIFFRFPQLLGMSKRKLVALLSLGMISSATTVAVPFVFGQIIDALVS